MVRALHSFVELWGSEKLDGTDQKFHKGDFVTLPVRQRFFAQSIQRSIEPIKRRADDLYGLQHRLDPRPHRGELASLGAVPYGHGRVQFAFLVGFLVGGLHTGFCIGKSFPEFIAH